LGPGILRGREERKRAFCYEERGEEEEGGEGEEGEKGPPAKRCYEEGEEKVLHILSKFHLDTDEVGRKVWEKYERIYENRKRRNEIHASENREKVALVYAICTVLNKERIPRPIGHIADLCGLSRHHLRRVLKIRETLNLGKEVLEDYSDGRAEDYVNAVCAHLGIPFSVGQQAERMLERREIKWALFGHRPHLLAAAVIDSVLKARGGKSRIADLCRELNCGENSVKRIMRKIPSKLCYE